jgi:hypothetical protein
MSTKPQSQHTVTLRERIDELVAQHGSLRAAARATRVEASYLLRLHNGEKKSPSDLVLSRLGLKVITTYERTNVRV